MLGLDSGEHGIDPTQVAVALQFDGGGLQQEVGVKLLRLSGLFFRALSAGEEESDENEYNRTVAHFFKLKHANLDKKSDFLLNFAASCKKKYQILRSWRLLAPESR